MNPKYRSLEAFVEAIGEEKEDNTELAMHLDSGDLIVTDKNGACIFRGKERNVLMYLFDFFLGIDYEEI